MSGVMIMCCVACPCTHTFMDAWAAHHTLKTLQGQQCVAAVSEVHPNSSTPAPQFAHLSVPFTSKLRGLEATLPPQITGGDEAQPHWSHSCASLCPTFCTSEPKGLETTLSPQITAGDEAQPHSLHSCGQSLPSLAPETILGLAFSKVHHHSC